MRIPVETSNVRSSAERSTAGRRDSEVPIRSRHMGRRTNYLPGTFSRVELVTTDAASAGAFYTGLFGWTVDAIDAGGTVYSLCRLEGAAVCGFFPLSGGAQPASTAPGWTSYVTVGSAEATASARGRARRLCRARGVRRDGRRTHVPAGRSQGAPFAVWEARARIGAERVNDVGCLCMNELVTSDLDAARAFYERLFSWTTEPVDTGPGGPTLIAVHNGPTLDAHMGEEPGPPHWRAYFTVESTAATITRLQALGGSVLAGPIPIPGGSIAVVRDPQGAEFRALRR